MSIEIDIGSTVTSHLDVLFKEKPISQATGFFYKSGEHFFLITNWHVVTGRHFQTLRPLDKINSALPDKIKFSIGMKHDLVWTYQNADLYEDYSDPNSPQKPLWLEHPVHGHKVDVVAIPIAFHWKDLNVRTIDQVNTAAKMKLRIASDVFIVGYPVGIKGGGELPIWKRASIASEPNLQLDGLPQIYVDTATREGMSGSPAIAVARTGFEAEAGFMAMGEHGYRFVGVYSGRLGEDQIYAQIGIIWRASVIEEIIQGGKKGTSSFSM